MGTFVPPAGETSPRCLFPSRGSFTEDLQSACHQWLSPTQPELPTPVSVASPSCCWPGKAASTRCCTKSSWLSLPCTRPSASLTGETERTASGEGWPADTIVRCFESLILVHHFHPFRFLLHDDQKRYFEKLAIYCNHYASLIPMSFVLGKLYWWSRQLLDNRKRGRNWATVCPRPLLCMVFASFCFGTLNRYN